MKSLVALIPIITLTQLACATSYRDQRSRSKHFRDGQFHNPISSAKSFWSFIRMRLSESYTPWPKWRESTPGPAPEKKVDGPQIQVRVINHATVLLQVGGINILTDPIYSERCSPISWAGPKRVRNPGLRFEDLPKIDFVLISHDHYDHLDLSTIQGLIQHSNPLFLMGLGVGERFPPGARLEELDWWEQSQQSSTAKLHFVPVQHFSGRGLFDRNSTLWGGFVIELEGRKIYFGGDTGYADHFRQTRERFGNFDLALLPIGAYEPRDFMAYAHINPEEAVRAHLDLGAKASIGIHFGTFQLTKEGIDDPIRDLEAAKKKFQIKSEEFLAPEFGLVYFR